MSKDEAFYNRNNLKKIWRYLLRIWHQLPAWHKIGVMSVALLTSMTAIWPDDNFESLGQPEQEKSLSPFLVSPAKAYSAALPSSADDDAIYSPEGTLPKKVRNSLTTKAGDTFGPEKLASSKQLVSSSVPAVAKSTSNIIPLNAPAKTGLNSVSETNAEKKAALNAQHQQGVSHSLPRRARSDHTSQETHASDALVHHVSDSDMQDINDPNDASADKATLASTHQPSDNARENKTSQYTSQTPARIVRTHHEAEPARTALYSHSQPARAAYYAPSSRLREIAYREPAKVEHLNSGKALRFQKDQDGELEEFYIEVDGLNVSARNNSYDPDGKIVHHYWDYGNGKGSLDQSPSWSYDKPGDYEISLTVYDDDGASSTYSHVVSVDDGNVLPKADFTVQTIGLDAKADNKSFDVDGDIVMAHWDFGDGRTSEAFSPEWRYKEPGAYVVTLTVLDNVGAKNAFERLVHVDTGNIAPVARFTVRTAAKDSSLYTRQPDGTFAKLK
ncbi:PKD domain-containing protein [Enterovibrio coralii]|uniref:PKD domain-containing protein n=1 Tax=Enterovibrio coralii TaxID=294935 RepID=A0A135I8I0_9GAMM|nr:PKD domain-containing protein [Enterovibrio coralii]KXF81727.1 hypothetical protein ATN88_03510 [Enterovibrio coralii]